MVIVKFVHFPIFFLRLALFRRALFDHLKSLYFELPMQLMLQLIYVGWRHMRYLTHALTHSIDCFITYFSGNPLSSSISQSIAIFMLKFLNDRPKQDLNLGQSRIAVFEDCKDTALTTQPSQLDKLFKQLFWFLFPFVSVCSWKWIDIKLISSRLAWKQPCKWGFRWIEKVVSTISAWSRSQPVLLLFQVFGSTAPNLSGKLILLKKKILLRPLSSIMQKNIKLSWLNNKWRKSNTDSFRMYVCEHYRICYNVYQNISRMNMSELNHVLGMKQLIFI